MEDEQSKTPTPIEQQRQAGPQSSSSGSSLSSPASSPGGALSRESFISRLGEAAPARPQPDARNRRPRVLGVHHLKFAVSNLNVSLAWYERVLGAQRVPELDHHGEDGQRFAAVCHLADWDGLYVEFRLAEDRAQLDAGWDPITLCVGSRQDLMLWVEWLDTWRTAHSQPTMGVRGWLLMFDDPDGRRIALYTREAHSALARASTARPRT